MFGRVMRFFVIIVFSGLGFGFSYYYLPNEFWGIQITSPVIRYGFVSLATLGFAFLGAISAPVIADRALYATSLIEQLLNKMSFQEIIGGVIGLIIGLIIATLLGSAITWLPWVWVGGFLKIAVTLLLGYLGLSVGMKRREELVSFLPRFSKERPTKTELKPVKSFKILDTSVIIDGRIADICKSGFIEGVLIIPGFVLEELRHIADSADLLKRNRGRRGLDILNKIRKELDVMVQIDDHDFEEIAEVDSKLVKLGQLLNGKLVTNDYNLNKVAELQGVGVLNINELANAVKPVVLPGEEMVVQIIKDGKESGQGVAYLDDGTMIVVDGGRKYVGNHIGVIVTSVLQTAAGRMIFAKIKTPDRRGADQDTTSSFEEVNALG